LQRDVHLPIDLGAVKVHAAQHGQDVTRGRIHGDQSGIGSIALAKLGDALTGDLLGHVLHIEIQRGVDVITATVQGLCAKASLELGTDIFHPVRCLTILSGLLGHEGEWRCRRSIELLKVDIAFCQHQAQHDRASIQRRLRVDIRIVEGRCLQEAR